MNGLLRSRVEASLHAKHDSFTGCTKCRGGQKGNREKPTQYAGYNLLATALVRRAQETPTRYRAQARSAVKKSLELSPNSFEAEKIQVSILLEEHEFPAALDARQRI